MRSRSGVDRLDLLSLGVGGRGLQEVQRPPGVPARGLRDEGERLVVQPEIPGAQTPRAVPQRAFHDPHDRLGRQGLQDDDLAARQQGAVELEGGVLRRRADQHDVSRLGVGQEDVLLRAVEAVDLVQEEDRALLVPGPHAPGLLEDLAHLLHAGRDRRVRQKERRGLRRDQPGERRLADAGRAPQDQRRNAVLRDRAAQEAVLADHTLGPLDLVQGSGPHAVRQRRRRREIAVRRRRAGRVLKELAGHEACASSCDARHCSEQTGTISPPRRPRTASRRSIQVPQTGSRIISPAFATPGRAAVEPGCPQEGREEDAQPAQDREQQKDREEDEDDARHQPAARRLEICAWMRSRLGTSG